jgi:hypothetical protein
VRRRRRRQKAADIAGLGNPHTAQNNEPADRTGGGRGPDGRGRERGGHWKGGRGGAGLVLRESWRGRLGEREGPGGGGGGAGQPVRQQEELCNSTSTLFG